MKKMNIIFMGTTDFAASCLDFLVQNNCNIVSVVTTPDKPAGRGLRIKISEVKEYAQNNNLPILQPENFNDKHFIDELNSLNPSLFVVVAFKKIPHSVWCLPSMGTINLHASYLPDYRGAAPIHWAVINGEKQTGVTTFFINDKIDAGDIILQKRIPITEDDTVGMLYIRLMNEGKQVLLETVQAVSNNTIQVTEQKLMSNKKAPKLSTEMCQINWTQDVHKVYNFIRGLNPFPSARSFIIEGDKKTAIKIFDVEKEIEEHVLKSGTIIRSKTEFKIAVMGGFIKINLLQIAGKKKMSALNFLNGNSLKEAARMGAL